MSSPCTDPENFVRGGPTLTVFLVDGGRDDPNATISETPFKRRFSGVLMMAPH